MHVHAKPMVAPTPAAPAPAKAVRMGPAHRSDIEALLATAKDGRGGAGSRPRRRPEDVRSDEVGPDAKAPATSLAVLLTELALDRDAPGADAPV